MPSFEPRRTKVTELPLAVLAAPGMMDISQLTLHQEP